MSIQVFRMESALLMHSYCFSKRGESAAFICKKKEGEYYAFAKLVTTSGLDVDSKDGLQEYEESKSDVCSPESNCIWAFMLNPDSE